MAFLSVLLLEACWVGILFLGDLGTHLVAFLVLYAIAFVGYLIAVRNLDGLSFSAVLAFGIIFRLTVLAIKPSLSDDIYRYLWDGLVQLQGINPYQFAPGDPELAVILRPDILKNVNHPHLPTIYPPFAQFFFRICAWIAPEVWVIKIGVVVWDCLAVFFLAGLARAYDIHPAAVALYFWNPLVVLEGAGHGHIDVVAVSLLVSALLYIRLKGYGRAGAALALSGLTKFLPVLMLPAFWGWAARGEKDGKSGFAALFKTRAIALPVVFAAVFVGAYLPFSGVGWSVLGSLQAYALTWEFNAPLYGLLRDFGIPNETSRLILSLIFFVGIAVVSLKPMPAIQAAYYVLGMFIVLTPTLHPWYIVWIVPFLCFYGNRGWLAMSGFIVLAYVVLIQFREMGVWEEAGWVRWLIFGGSVSVWLWPRIIGSLRKSGGPPLGDPPGQTD